MKKVVRLLVVMLISYTLYGCGGVGREIADQAGKAAGREVTKQALSSNGSIHSDIQKSIEQMADTINKQTPIKVDAETTLNRVTVYDGGFAYHYSLVNYSSHDIDVKAFRADANANLKSRACGSEEMKVFFKNKVKIQYTYKGNDGGQITTILVTPADCGY